MLRNVVFFILSSPYYLAAAHPQCHYDEREVDLKTEMTFCSMEYAASGVCCTDLEEAALKETFTAASDGLTAECADYYKQLLCGVCGSYSGHLYERLADDLGTEDGLTMANEFCTGLTTACEGQIEFPDYDGEDYCTMHTGGGDDLWWSYPYQSTGVFTGEFEELFPDLPDSDRPAITLAMHQSPDGSAYWISGQGGIIVGVDADSMSSSSTVLDLSETEDLYYESYEEGLLDFAFSPMFYRNGFFYVSWTVSDTYKKNRLSKFQYFAGNPNATLDSEEILLETSERSTFTHNGGWLGFKPSDYAYNTDNNDNRDSTRKKPSRGHFHDLYWTIGDAGPQEDPEGHAQRTDVIFGSVVRISVPSHGTGYKIPRGNYPDAEMPEICAIGFRNHWRCGFDRLNDELYCGDVGYNYIESIYKIECGNNYGWVRFEGSRCTEFSEDDYGPCANADRSGYVFPIFEYCHFDFDSSPSSQEDYTGGNNICGDRGIVGNSVIGGHVYRGQAFNDLIYGAYVFADFTARSDYFFGNEYHTSNGSRSISYILQQEDGTWTSGTIISDQSVGVVSISEDMDGELFIIDDSNNIFYLPCGDLCIEDTGTIDDDSLSIPDSYIYLGCYADDSSRVLSGKYDTSDPGMTTELCAEFCQGYAYFGTQYRHQCFCGEATDEPASLGSATCNMPCAGNSTQICGGRWALSMYEFSS